MTEQKEIRVGVLGCGQIAQIMHLPYLHDLPGLRVWSLCDISQNTLRQVGGKYGVPTERQYLDFDQLLLDPELDAVLICSKDHCDPVVKAARAKKHIFVEKPFGFNLTEAELMVKEAQENHVKLMVGYMKRYDGGFLYLLDQLKEMKDISLVRVHDFGGSFAYTRELFDVLGGGDVPPEVLAQGKDLTNQSMLQGIGADKAGCLSAYSLLLGVACHDSVLLRHAFGSEPEVLFADVHGGFLTAILRYGGIQCVFESGLVMNRRIWDETFSVYSGDKNLTLSFPWPYLKNAPSTVHVSDNLPGTCMPRESVVSPSFQEAYRSEWQHFYDCVVNDQEPLTSGADALKDIRLMTRLIQAVPGESPLNKG